MPTKSVNTLVKRLAEQNKWQELEKILKGKKEFEEKGTNSFVVLFGFEGKNTPFKFENIKIEINDLETPLLLAAEKGHFETCKLLLEHGFKVDAVDRNLTSVLQHAITSGNYDLCSLLKEHGASIDTTDDLGVSPLQTATALGYNDTYELLSGKATTTASVSVRDRISAYESQNVPRGTFPSSQAVTRT